MKEKTIVDWEKEKSNTSSQLVRSRIPTQEQGESIICRQGVGSVEEQSGAGSGDGVECGAGPIERHPIGSEEEEVADSESDDEAAEVEEEESSEPTDENKGRRYPLRNRRPP